MKAVLIRADAHAAIGTGHVLRSLALAQGFRERGIEVHFLTYCESDSLAARIRGGGCILRQLSSPHDRAETLDAVGRSGADAVALDGYAFDAAFQGAIRATGAQTLVIDDRAHLNRYEADLLLNQNFGSEALSYACNPDARKLLGPRFVLLREEFRRAPPSARSIPAVARKVLVTFGGADIPNGTEGVIRAASTIAEPLELRVLVGTDNAHGPSLRSAASSSPHVVDLLESVEDMRPLFEWADLAVSAGGTTVYELAYMGTPNLAAVIAANQEQSVRALADAGFVHNLGWIGRIDLEEIAGALSALVMNRHAREELAARRLVDGRGVERTIVALETAVNRSSRG